MGAGAAEAGVRPRLAADEKMSKSVGNVLEVKGLVERYGPDQPGVPAGRRDGSALANSLAPGTPLAKPEGVFPRFQEEGEPD